MKKTGVEGERSQEGIKINEGVLELGNAIKMVIHKGRLIWAGRVYVLYWWSKLT